MLKNNPEVVKTETRNAVDVMKGIKMQNTHIKAEMKRLALLNDGTTNPVVTTRPVILLRGSSPKCTAESSSCFKGSVDTSSWKRRRRDERTGQSSGILPKPNSTANAEADGFVTVSQKKTESTRKSVTDNRASQGRNNDHKREKPTETGTKRKRKPQKRRILQDAVLIKLAEQKTFADIIIKGINAMKIHTVLRIESTNVLVELGGNARNKRLFTDALNKAVVSVAGKLRNLDAQETVKIID